MAVIWSACIVCDQCGAESAQVSKLHTPQGVSRAAWDAITAKGWVTKNEGGRRVHYCPFCWSTKQNEQA